MTALRELCNATMAGYADYRENTPEKRVPAGEWDDPLVCAYWDGWDAGVQDFVAKFVRARRRKEKSA